MPNFSVNNTISPGDPSDANKAMANWTGLVNNLNRSGGGGLDGDNLTATAASQLGLSDTVGPATRRGAVSIATAESTSSATYTTLTTPDKVSSVVLPTNGLLLIGYVALWQNSVGSAGRAAIFIGANQLKNYPTTGGVATVQEVTGNNSTGVNTVLASNQIGLGGSTGSATTEVTTGVTVGNANNGGFAVVTAAAGTYDISVQFKASSGSVTVQNRHLWVWTIGF